MLMDLRRSGRTVAGLGVHGRRELSESTNTERNVEAFKVCSGKQAFEAVNPHQGKRARRRAKQRQAFFARDTVMCASRVRVRRGRADARVADLSATLSRWLSLETMNSLADDGSIGVMAVFQLFYFRRWMLPNVKMTFKALTSISCASLSNIFSLPLRSLVFD